MSLLRNLFRKLGIPERTSFVAVGYPKTGNTWTRLLLGTYLQLLHRLPDVPLFDEGETEDQSAVIPRGSFTHHPLEWQDQTASDLDRSNVIKPFAGDTVILLVRHPLDVAVSFFMHQKHQKSSFPYPGDLVQFVDDPVYGLEKFFAFHRIWAERADRDPAVFISRYEDLRLDGPQALTALLEHLRVPIRPELVSEALDRTAFEKMRKLEQSDAAPKYKSSGFKIFSTGNPDNPEAFHVRKGQVGGYREYFPPGSLEALEHRVCKGMPDIYGYGAPTVA